MKIGLFFGSFNPIHIGHMAIANYMLEFTDLNKIWFIISPHNPLKEKKTLLQDHQRYQMVNLAIGDNHRMKASDIEFKLKQPSYTVTTLALLKEKYPDTQFVLLMGMDNLLTLKKWKNYQFILDEYEIYVYPRPGYENSNPFPNDKIKSVDAPLMEISSSFIREAINKGKDVRYFLPEKVSEYISEMHFYKS